MNEITRRGLIFGTATIGAYGLLVGVQRACRFALADDKPAKSDSGPVQIVKFSDDGTRLSVETVPKIVKSDADWRKSLSSDAFDVTRKADTERAFSGAYYNNHDPGLYRCVCCGNALFTSATKPD